MFKRNECASIREICSNAFVEHVIACDNRLKKSCVRAENSLKKAVVKISTWRIVSRSIVFPIVKTTVKDSWSSVPFTV